MFRLILSLVLALLAAGLAAQRHDRWRAMNPVFSDTPWLVAGQQTTVNVQLREWPEQDVDLKVVTAADDSNCEIVSQQESWHGVRIQWRAANAGKSTAKLQVRARDKGNKGPNKGTKTAVYPIVLQAFASSEDFPSFDPPSFVFWVDSLDEQQSVLCTLVNATPVGAAPKIKSGIVGLNKVSDSPLKFKDETFVLSDPTHWVMTANFIPKTEGAHSFSVACLLKNGQTESLFSSVAIGVHTQGVLMFPDHFVAGELTRVTVLNTGGIFVGDEKFMLPKDHGTVVVVSRTADEVVLDLTMSVVPSALRVAFADGSSTLAPVAEKTPEQAESEDCIREALNGKLKKQAGNDCLCVEAAVAIDWAAIRNSCETKARSGNVEVDGADGSKINVQVMVRGEKTPAKPAGKPTSPNGAAGTKPAKQADGATGTLGTNGALPGQAGGAGNPGGHGTAGDAGGNGEQGTWGDPGDAASDIPSPSIKAPGKCYVLLIFCTKGGDGGDGGGGGNGGPGGPGGDGGNGGVGGIGGTGASGSVDANGAFTGGGGGGGTGGRGGNGGPGGTGGTGGNGGQAGYGGNGGQGLSVQVTAEHVFVVVFLGHGGNGGNGGNGGSRGSGGGPGSGGNAGSGGAGGAAGPGAPAGNAGQAGSNGSDGAAGTTGQDGSAADGKSGGAGGSSGELDPKSTSKCTLEKVAGTQGNTGTRGQNGQ